VATFRAFLTLPANFRAGEQPGFAPKWQAQLDEFLESPVVTTELRRMYDTNRDIRALQRLALIPVSRISEDDPSLSPLDLYDGAVAQNRDAKAAILIGVSILELCLLIAMANITTIQDTAFNFEVVYDQYKSFVLEGGQKAVEWYSKPVAFKAFERLVDMELVRRVGAGNRNTPRQFQSMRLMMEPAQVQEVVQKYPKLPTHVKSWLRI